MTCFQEKRLYSELILGQLNAAALKREELQFRKAMEAEAKVIRLSYSNLALAFVSLPGTHRGSAWQD